MSSPSDVTRSNRSRLCATPLLTTAYGGLTIGVAVRRDRNGLFGAEVRITSGDSEDPPRAELLLAPIFVSDGEAATTGILQGVYWIDLQQLRARCALRMLPSIRETDFDRLKATMVPERSLPARAAEWNAELDRRERRARDDDAYPMRVLVNLDDFAAFCERTGRPADLASLDAYAPAAASTQFIWLAARAGVN